MCMLFRYECGCIGLEPDGNEKGPLIVMACDTTGDDKLPSNVGRIVAYRREMKNPDNREPLSEIAIASYFKAVGELKGLACIGQDFLDLTKRARWIDEKKTF